MYVHDYRYYYTFFLSIQQNSAVLNFITTTTFNNQQEDLLICITMFIADMLIARGYVVQSLGCTLYALAYLEAPFEKVYQSGGSIALAALSGKIHFPATSG
jgi:hypothetical protein